MAIEKPKRTEDDKLVTSPAADIKEDVSQSSFKTTKKHDTSKMRHSNGASLAISSPPKTNASLSAIDVEVDVGYYRVPAPPSHGGDNNSVYVSALELVYCAHIAIQ